ncbi:hypothetical protein JCGZ_18132 [Jatropha curcas]|uniref:Uncharacterized protein n=1 Tax=Jatropha curcas TaxID=180498 RepID=A0A067K1X0_JATCU|nr:hypothetical protein JCGZ_18132 [Jatropha curcas]
MRGSVEFIWLEPCWSVHGTSMPVSLRAASGKLAGTDKEVVSTTTKLAGTSQGILSDYSFGLFSGLSSFRESVRGQTTFNRANGIVANFPRAYAKIMVNSLLPLKAQS